MQNNLFTPLYDIANEGAVCALLRQLSGLDRSVKNSSASRIQSEGRYYEEVSLKDLTKNV